MAKRDKDYENRMAGYIGAFNKAKAEGLDALERDIKMRNLLKVDINVPEKKMREYFDEISKNLYHNTMTVVGWTLHDTFGFGKERLKKFKKEFDKTVKATTDLDYLGEHYVKLEDFAIELNHKFDMGIDSIRVSACQDVHDEENEAYRSCKIDRVLQELKNGGYSDAAEFIEQKLY